MIKFETVHAAVQRTSSAHRQGHAASDMQEKAEDHGCPGCKKMLAPPVSVFFLIISTGLLSAFVGRYAGAEPAWDRKDW